jgi:hypothetical protein
MSEFRITPEQVEMLHKARKPAASKRPVRQQSKFIMLPYRPTVTVAAALGQAEWAIIGYLTYESWWQSKETVLLPSLPFRKAGFSRSAKSRALRHLEQIGLVRVTRRRHRNPLVSLRWDMYE